MEEKKLLFNIGPIWFDGTIVLMVLLTCIIVFAFVYACTRNMKLRPKGKQTVIEWLVDFIRGIITDNLPRKEVSNFHLMAFTLFMFVLVSNILGLVTKIVVGDDLSVWKSPTADPIVTLTLAMMMIVLTHFFGMKRFGFKGYLVNSYLRPVGFLLPVKLMEEFTNLLTLACVCTETFCRRSSIGLNCWNRSKRRIMVIPLAIPLEMIWVAFSIFIGCIQAFIFVTLSMVYMSHKIETEE